VLGVLADEVSGLSSSGLAGLRSVLVSAEDSLGEFHGIASEGVTELLGDHHLDDGGLAVLHLVSSGLLDGVLDIVLVGDGDAFGSHGSSDLSVGVVSLELRADVSVSEPEDLVLLLSSPLTVVEDNSGGGNIFTNASEDFVQGHAPSTVTDVGEGGSFGAGNLGTDGSGEGVSTVTVGHGSEHGGLGVVEAEVRVRYGTDVSDISGNHSVLGEGVLHLSEHGTRLHSSLFGRLSTEVGEGVELGFPSSLQLGDVSFTLGLVGHAGDAVRSLKAGQKRGSRLLAISVNETVDVLGKSKASLVNIDLDDFGILREVVEVVLRKSSEDGESRSESNDDISFMHGVHGGLVALVSKVTDRQTMIGGERIVVEVGARNGDSEIFGKSSDFGVGISHGDTTTSKDDGVLGVLDQLNGVLKSLFTSSGVHLLLGGTDDVLVLTIEEVTGDVDLDGSTLVHGNVEGLSGKLGHAGRVVDVGLEFGNSREHGHLVELLETTVTLGHGTSLGGDADDGGVSPVSSGNSGEEVGDSGTVLGNADSVSSRGTSVTISHVGSVLLVSDRDESDSSTGPEIKGVHEGRSHNSEGVGNTVSNHLLNEGLGVRHVSGDSESDFLGILGGKGTLCGGNESCRV